MASRSSRRVLPPRGRRAGRHYPVSFEAMSSDIPTSELLDLQFALRLQHRTGGPGVGIPRQGCALSCATDTVLRPPILNLSAPHTMG